jgi:hypothetical protein
VPARAASGGVERPVELEDARAVAVALEAPAVRPRQPRPRQREEPARRDVEQHRSAGRDLVERLDAPPGLDRPAQPPHLAGERVGDLLRAAARHRPPDGVAADRQHHPERGARRRAEREHRVRARAGQQRARPLALEPRPPGGAQAVAREARQQQRMPRRPRRAQQLREQRPRLPHQRAERLHVRALVDAEARRRLLDRPVQEHRGAVVERMCKRYIGVHEVERQLSQERRRERQRVHGGAQVVDEPGERQLRGAAAAAQRRLSFEHRDFHARAGEHERGGQAVRARADDDRGHASRS